jgi:hypothetical protein
MTTWLIPDSGPLFSLAAGGLLPLLAHFRVGITDVVRAETIDRGMLTGASIEAQNLLAYYNANAANITTLTTQVGALIAKNPPPKPPPNLGELSIQSFLTELQVKSPGAHPVILFEDGWFLNNANALNKPYTLLSTQAFLEYAQEKKWIVSAQQARAAIAIARPGAYENSIHISS